MSEGPLKCNTEGNRLCVILWHSVLWQLSASQWEQCLAWCYQHLNHANTFTLLLSSFHSCFDVKGFLIMFISTLCHCIQIEDKAKQTRMSMDDLFPVEEGKTTISLCFMYFLGQKCDFLFSSCYCRTEEHIPHWANVLPFCPHCDDLLALISSRSGDWQRIIQMIALILGYAWRRNARLSVIALQVSSTPDFLTRSGPQLTVLGHYITEACSSPLLLQDVSVVICLQLRPLQESTFSLSLLPWTKVYREINRAALFWSTNRNQFRSNSLV
jgi:hypothetical protein